MSVNFFVKFVNARKDAFSVRWWAYLLATGISIGFVTSSKWVGLFSMALVGLHTAWHLLCMWKQPSTFKTATVLWHFLARALGLLAVPAAVYMTVFAVHFRVLHSSGPGDSTMSSLFQASRFNSPIAKSPLQVVYGSRISLKNRSVNGGLLHSHIQKYEVGSRQQQVTIYHHRDANNMWQLVKQERETKEELENITDGCIVKLMHIPTQAFLHSHAFDSILTVGDNEVTCYGSPSSPPDPNDLWKVEFVTGKGKSMQTLHTTFRLKHVVYGCNLRYTGKSLPAWGFSQGEITCSATAGKDCLWNVEENEHTSLPAISAAVYRSNFLQDFIDCNANMFRSNSSLKTGEELEPSALTSSPWQWPILYKGIRMAGWDDSATKFYMLANPFVAALCGMSLIFSCLALAIIFIASSRNPSICLSSSFLWKQYVSLGGWMLHYFPFMIMGRVLYFHHYYPSLLFGILNTGILFDCLPLDAVSRKRAVYCCIVLCIAVFWMFAPICYGMAGPIAKYSHLKWNSRWL